MCDPTCPVCGNFLEGDEYTSALMCPWFQPHEDLCPEPDSGPWYCNTDGFTDFVECDGCDMHRHPDDLTTCSYTEPDGNIDSFRFCKDCISDNSKPTVSARERRPKNG